MNSIKAEKSLAKCQFLSHFTRFPPDKFFSHAKQLKLSNQPLNLINFSIVDLYKQVIQMAFQKIYLYLICNVNKSQLYLSEKTYVTNQGLIFTFFDLSDKYRKRLIRRDTGNFGKNIIEIYDQLKKTSENLGNLKSQRGDELKKFMIRNIENFQTQWTPTKTIEELQKLDIFKQNIMLLNYVQNSVLRAVRDKKSYLNNFFIQWKSLLYQHYQIGIKAASQPKIFFEMITTMKRFLEEATKTIKLKLKPTQDQFKSYGIYQKIQTLNKINKQVFIKKLKQQFLFDYSYQSRELQNKEYNKSQKQICLSAVQDQVFVHAQFFKQDQESTIKLQLSVNFEWKIDNIDFSQFQLVFNQIIQSLSEVQTINQTDKIIQRGIKGFSMRHHSSSYTLLIEKTFQLKIVNSVFYQFTYAIDQMLLLTKILTPIAQIYSQKSMKEILQFKNKKLGLQQLFILKQQAKRCYVIYNQLFLMFCQSKKN